MDVTGFIILDHLSSLVPRNLNRSKTGFSGRVATRQSTKSTLCGPLGRL